MMSSKLTCAIILYFDNDTFKANLCNNLSTFGFRNISCEVFENLFMCILNEHAPMKKRYIRANNAPFMNKELCKAIMTRSRFRNIFLKLKTNESRETYKIQRNYCVKLLRKTKSCYDENLNVKIIQDNKKSWKHVKPLFSQKDSINNRVTLVEYKEIVSDSAKCAEIMNNFFSDAVFSLDINRELHTDVSTSSDPVISAIESYKNDPSIMKLNEKMPNLTFNFQSVSENDMLRMIQSIDSTKAFQKNDFPPNILIANEDICSIVLTADIN